MARSHRFVQFMDQWECVGSDKKPDQLINFDFCGDIRSQSRVVIYANRDFQCFIFDFSTFPFLVIIGTLNNMVLV